MENLPVTLFADFNNNDREGRLRLNLNGTIKDLEAKGMILSEGLEVILTDGDELSVLATIEFSKSENIWVGKFDDKDVKYL
ncbi:hypothetical protein [Mucilaginibacter myungsuensis]|uniref:Uncharacterized protein n=1 Tax=Mucilaginibacter myungsuensis TaxID=649104 RepID=A0A929KZ69_9SPHI|nr:hypothetical protein [Mucilaginibacter myungsuensis]MBE9663250.1 hypothetical protein [Mucilaginibacter myungsuensis]MDN3598883.1 hypothetical protein [Mucilaginibacter myungsuensis]